jgi:hypothetical protein
MVLCFSYFFVFVNGIFLDIYSFVWAFLIAIPTGSLGAFLYSLLRPKVKNLPINMNQIFKLGTTSVAGICSIWTYLLIILIFGIHLFSVGGVIVLVLIAQAIYWVTILVAYSYMRG